MQLKTYFRTLVLILNLGCGSFAGATLTLVDYSRYVYTVDETDKSNVKLYAGMTSTSCSSTSTTTTCDSCASSSTVRATSACNTKQINPNLLFKVSIKSDKSDLFKGGNSVYVKFAETEVARTFDSNQFAANKTMDVYITWSALCAAAVSGNTGCTSSFSEKSLFVGIGTSSSSFSESVKFTISFRYVGTSEFQSFHPECSDARTYESFCYFYVFPGDEKVYLQTTVQSAGSNKVLDLSGATVSDVADASGMSYSGLRVFYEASNSYSSIKLNSPSVDFLFNGTSLSSNKVSGLTNGQQYVFLTAPIDQGGNITLFTNPQDSELCSATDNACLQSPYTDSRGYFSQTAIPNKVVGLLDSEKCFIATAAYGSPMDPQVEAFREFRDRFLMTHTVGRYFVDLYYQFSPPLAEWIYQSEDRRAVARYLLWPLSQLVQWMNQSAVNNKWVL